MASIGTLAIAAAIGVFASRPAHTVGGPVAVAVSNTIANQDIDNPDRQPFLKYVSVNTVNTDNTAVSVPVPAGKRLVIETVTAYREAVSQPAINAQIYLRGQVNGVSGLYGLPLLTNSLRITTQPMRFRADPGTNVLVIASLSGPVASEIDDVTLSGYLVDVP